MPIIPCMISNSIPIQSKSSAGHVFAHLTLVGAEGDVDVTMDVVLVVVVAADMVMLVCEVFDQPL